MAIKDKALPKPTMADLEALGVDAEALIPGASLSVDSVYVRRYKSGKLGFGGKVRTADGRVWQVTTAVFIR